MKFSKLHELVYNFLFMPCNLDYMHSYELKCVQFVKIVCKGIFVIFEKFKDQIEKG